VKILFDHCVARPLRKEMPHHEIKTTHEMGWAGLKNGKLLEKAEEAGFEVLSVQPGQLYEVTLPIIP